MTITIRLKRNGPYVIALEQADQVTIVDADGTTIAPQPGRSVALCRCGGSATKPFCDRSHRVNGFDGTCSVPVDEASRPLENPGDPAPPPA